MRSVDRSDSNIAGMRNICIMVRSTECGFAVKEYRLARRQNDSSSKVDEAPTADTFAALCRPVTILRGMLPKSTRQCRAKRKWL
ncbi:hypothetical protein RB195_003708 [Necator americanus]|uniref:Uncharacterized protein n=1 Tax=Necator americanus TaxID=51031 RepID=A0ABR1DPU5_NECAM